MNFSRYFTDLLSDPRNWVTSNHIYISWFFSGASTGVFQFMFQQLLKWTLLVPDMLLFHMCRLPWHLVSERIRRKNISFTEALYPLIHKTLRLRHSCVSAIKAKCWMNNRHDLLCTRTALALISLLPGQIPAGSHLFIICVIFPF